MIISELHGGLGNQMFQYAAAKALALHNDVQLKIDLKKFDTYTLRNYELNCFTLNSNIANFLDRLPYHDSLISKVYMSYMFRVNHISYKHYREPHYHFDQSFFELPKNTYITGYFASEKYFTNIEKEIRDDFRFIKLKNNLNKKLVNKIKKSKSVSIHIRRGDYITNKNANKFHGVVPLSYYKTAIDYIKNKFDSVSFFVFSDDSQWAKENLNIKDHIEFITHNTGSNSFRDMQLMSYCKHNIIANSTFSWWGAWLNSYKEKIIIAPKIWIKDTSVNTNDVYPTSWIKI